MENKKKFPHIHGGVNLKSDLTIEEVGEILSTQVLGGIHLGGKEKNIYEEVPAIFNSILGYTIVLQGYSGFDHEWGFSLSIIPDFNPGKVGEYDVNLNNYLCLLLKDKLKDIKDIIVIELEID